MNYTKTLEFIHSLGNFSKPPTLDRIKSVLEKLGNPQNNFKSIHIAGTNGKGSVSAMLHSVFKSAGFKTGLFISPYIIDFCERIQINGEFIDKSQLCTLSQRIIDTGVELTEFEFITAVAFLYFSEQECDIAVIETGLGGRLDATNSLEKVIANVITKIGLDHTAILGDTIGQITKEKCGIIKNCPVITSFNQPQEAMLLLNKYNPIIPNTQFFKKIKSDIFGNEFIYKSLRYKTLLCGEHQIENALLCIETVLNCGIKIPSKALKQGIAETFFPARMELISKTPLVMLDGAHNPDGAQILAEVMKNFNGKITAIAGMMADKDCEEVLKQTLPYCKKVVAVQVKDMPRSLTAEQLKAISQKYCETELAQNYDDALEKIKGHDTVFVFGSLYLASGIREKLKNFYKT